MAVETPHPQFTEYLEDWEQMEDTFDGQRKVKEAGEKYLPSTSGMQADGMREGQPGRRDYDNYRKRAVFHDFVKDAVTTMVNVMHRKPAVITLPPRMQPLMDRATDKGEGLQALLRLINFNQLLNSRFGLLVEVPSGQGPSALPFVTTYKARTIRNWFTGDPDIYGQPKKLEMLVLDESGPRLDPGSLVWADKPKYRVLLDPGSPMMASVALPEGSTTGNFWSLAVLSKDSGLGEAASVVQPQIAGKGLGYIPFTFINAGDLTSEPEAPVLIGLSNLTLAIYRGEADYRQTLFLQGQDTLVTIGATVDEGDGESTRVGAGAKLEVPLGGDAKYIGVSADGLAEQRQALNADKEQAAERGARLLDFGDTARQSGDALRIRVAARTTTLTTVAMTGAAGLEQCLRQIAEMIGEDPAKVTIQANLDFTDDSFTGQDVLEFMQAKAMGAPLSLRTIHENFRRRDLTEKTFDQEMEEIEVEKPLVTNTALDIRRPDPTKPTEKTNNMNPQQKAQSQTPGPSNSVDN